VFDHSSVGQFLEKRFGVHVPAISPWHRAVCGDLTSAFDFSSPNDVAFPELPTVSGSAAVIATISQRPKPTAPATPEQLSQEPGTRPSRALPYELHATAQKDHHGKLAVVFRNTGRTDSCARREGSCSRDAITAART
jgi:phospholipase C